MKKPYELLQQLKIPDNTEKFFDNKILDEWLTTKEASELLKISEKTLLNLASVGKVPFYKLGRRNRYLKSELNDLLLSEKRGVLYDN